MHEFTLHQIAATIIAAYIYTYFIIKFFQKHYDIKKTKPQNWKTLTVGLIFLSPMVIPHMRAYYFPPVHSYTIYQIFSAAVYAHILGCALIHLYPSSYKPEFGKWEEYLLKLVCGLAYAVLLWPFLKALFS